MLPVVGPFDMGRSDLRDFECTDADIPAEVDHEIVAVTGGGMAQLLEPLVVHPDLVLVWPVRCFESHRKL